MDALALLCTLHADGPTTLKRLRAAGCPSLEALLGFEAEELARLIDLPAARSRRLKREARLLAERISGDLLQPEDNASKAPAPAPPAVTPVRDSLVSAAAAEPLATGPWPEEFLPPEPTTVEASGPSSSLSGVDRRLLGRVLEHWNEKGAAASPNSAPERQVPAGQAPTAVTNVASPVAPPEVPSGHPLVAGPIDGLSGAHIERLRARGVKTVEDLVAADALSLARAIDMPFGALRRAQFLGARQLEPGATPAAEPDAAPPAAQSRPEKPVPASPTPAPPAPATKGESKTVLDWSFEIPRPAHDSQAQTEQPGGPFA